MGSLGLGFDSETLPILLVALVTWGGVLLYLVRLDMLTKKVEKEVRDYTGRDHAGRNHEESHPQS